MTELMTHLQVLLNRLTVACMRLPDMGGDLFVRGQAVLERKFGVEMWLGGFSPGGLMQMELFTPMTIHFSWCIPSLRQLPMNLPSSQEACRDGGKEQ